MKKTKSFTGEMMKVGMANIVGVGMISATSGMVKDMPSGTAKNISGIIPGLQSTALLAHNMKLVKSSLKSSKNKFI